MRLKSVTAATPAQALAQIRATLGDSAVIVATQALKGGGVRITAASEGDDRDLEALLSPPPLAGESGWLARLAEHHELPARLQARLREVLEGTTALEPMAALARALEELFRFRPLPEALPRPLLLCGPPGAGKTASLAKLAARAVLAGRRVRAITTDIGRAGGLEQLGALLAPLRLEPEPAPDAAVLRRLAGSAGADLVLIDSQGLNPFRPPDIGHLSTLIAAAGAEPVLVLPAGLAPADCSEIGHSFAALGSTRMLLTKLDAVRRLGGVLAAAEAGLAFCDAGIGPTIGKGLVPLAAAGLARLLLHGSGARLGEERRR
jgi:flagellar biosynthesis protein FlhF